MFRRFLAAIALAATALFVTVPALAASAVGIWYGVGQPDDPTIVYLDQFAEDGSFFSEFRKYEACVLIWAHIETGSWLLENDSLITLIETSDGVPVTWAQEYRTEGITDNELRLRHLETDYLFVERRMERFEFPECWAGV